MYRLTKDLAGEVCFRPNFWQTKARINYLIAEYLSLEQLCDRLSDLPRQIATEYGAACLYIWLMAHSTGTIQQVLGELLQDEINHLAKLWGMGMWLYPQGKEQLIHYLLSQINTILAVSSNSDLKSNSNLKSTFKRMTIVLNWQSWSISSRGELIYTFIWALKSLWYWSSQLTPEYLHSCCATPEFFGNNSFESNRPDVIVL